MPLLDRAFLWVRSCSLCYRFTLFTRILLAAGFLPTGMVKLAGLRFTTISVEHPVGAFFEAMYQTGLYWRFLGMSQVLAAVLLLLPACAHLGAALFLPIMINIFVITISMGFRGTPVVTGLMLLAVVYLVAWDFHRFRALLTRRPLHEPVPEPRLDRWERVGFAVFAVSLLAFFGATRGMVSLGLGPALIVTGTLAGLATVARFLWVWWFELRRPAVG